jgi:hypothetical protein
MNLDDLWTFDCEVYPNYFLAAFKHVSSGKTSSVSTSSQLSDDDIAKLTSIMSRRTTFGFNSRNYDIPIIQYALEGHTTEQIHALSDYIIENRSQGWQTRDKFNLPALTWDTFDIQEPAPGVMVSLKLYGGRMNSQRLQDLPIEPGTVLSSAQMDEIKDYCVNDLDTNLDLFDNIRQQIQLRVDMSEEYSQDLRSKSDAQIAEAVLAYELGGKSRPPKIPASTTYQYTAPSYLRFQSHDLKVLLSDIEFCEFGLSKSGSIELPPELKNRKVTIGTTTYKLGIGGLHSMEKKQAVKTKSSQILADCDVASYYPAIILNLGLYPKQLGPDFLTAYEGIVKRRLAAKRSGNKVVADSLKIVVNGSFGKLGSKYSMLYAPDLMLTVTLTGQLSLLMLIERIENAGIKVVSANTDGIVSLMDKDQYQEYLDIRFDWEIDTSFELEETRYSALYSRDVNNYLAISDHGPKGKGIFSENMLMKNPVAPICTEAAIKYLTEGVRVEETVGTCMDLTKFLTVRTVKGGAVWRDQYLGKVVRWIYSTDGEPIRYKSNGNKVAGSDGAMPVMELGGIPKSLDERKYINTAQEILSDVGAD